MMRNDIEELEEFLKKVKEFKESEEFKKTKEILDLIDTVDEVMKRYYDIITPKPKIGLSDSTVPIDAKEGFGEYGYGSGDFVDYYHEHAWVLKNSHTGGEDYQCATCGAWKSVNWSNDQSGYWFDMEYFHNDKTLGC